MLSGMETATKIPRFSNRSMRAFPQEKDVGGFDWGGFLLLFAPPLPPPHTLQQWNQRFYSMNFSILIFFYYAKILFSFFRFFFPLIYWLIIIIIIIIAFKGAIRDFLQSPHSAANCLQHVRSSGPGATVCKSRATHRALITCKCHVMCHLVRRDSSAVKFDRVEIAFIWALFYWLNH